MSRPSARPPSWSAPDTGAMAGTALGSLLGPAGGAVGGVLGRGLGYLYKGISGQGSYTVAENSIVQPSAEPVPAFGTTSIRIKNKEYLGDILTSSMAGGFTQTSFTLNPGLAGTFPWLSQIALNFQQYKFEGLVFEYISNSGDAITGTNTALGKLIIATDYNVLQPQFANEQSMLITEFSNFDKPSKNILHAIECSPALRSQVLNYIRNAEVPTGADLKTYDLGRTTVATIGAQGTNVNLGAIWVSYDVFLCKPYLNDFATRDSAHLYSTTTTNAAPLTGMALQGGSTLLPTINGNTITFNANAGQTLLVSAYWTGNSTALTFNALSTFGLVGVNLFGTDNTYQISSNGTTSTVMYFAAAYSVTSDLNGLIFPNSSTYPAVPTSAHLFITQLDTAIVT